MSTEGIVVIRRRYDSTNRRPVRSAILALVQRLEGFAPTEDPVPGITPHAANKALAKLRVEGVAFPMNSGHKKGRHFGTPEQAREFAKANAYRLAPMVRLRVEGSSSRRPDTYSIRKAASGPMIVTPATVYTKCPSPPYEPLAGWRPGPLGMCAVRVVR